MTTPAKAAEVRANDVMTDADFGTAQAEKYSSSWFVEFYQGVSGVARQVRYEAETETLKRRKALKERFTRVARVRSSSLTQPIAITPQSNRRLEFLPSPSLRFPQICFLEHIPRFRPFLDDVWHTVHLRQKLLGGVRFQPIHSKR